MAQLPESDIPVETRIRRIVTMAVAGCTRAQLEADAEVAVSVLQLAD